MTTRPEDEIVWPPSRWTPWQLRLVTFIALLAMVSATYRLVYLVDLEKTAALYVGLPALVAIGLVLRPRSTSAKQAAFRGSLLFICIAGVILPEGLICLLFVLPIVFVVAMGVATTVDAARARGRGQGPPLMAMGIPLLILSLEGVIGTPFDPHATATATITVEASADEVAAALARPPTFATEMPTFLRVGFNRPVAATGSGLAVGDGRAITFDGGTHDDHPLTVLGLARGEHAADHSASMHLTVTESAPGRVVFSVAHDGTMLARWVDLDRAVVTWRETGDGTTEVTWALEYERLLYPSFYFAPLQGYGMGQAAEYLLDAVVGGVDGVET